MIINPVRGDSFLEKNVFETFPKPYVVSAVKL